MAEWRCRRPSCGGEPVFGVGEVRDKKIQFEQRRRSTVGSNGVFKVNQTWNALLAENVAGFVPRPRCHVEIEWDGVSNPDTGEERNGEGEPAASDLQGEGSALSKKRREVST
jgi:hypothetical protein